MTDNGNFVKIHKREQHEIALNINDPSCNTMH